MTITRLARAPGSQNDTFPFSFAAMRAFRVAYERMFMPIRANTARQLKTVRIVRLKDWNGERTGYMTYGEALRQRQFDAGARLP